MNEPIRLPPKNCDRTLDEVWNDFGSRVCASGQYGEIDEWSVYDESFRRLVQWAKDKGCYFEGLEPLKLGGREHDLTFIPESETWLKFTKPSSAGFVVSFDTGSPSLEPALPLEYFERLLLLNSIFSDDVSFVGIGGSKYNPRIITRQKHVVGRAATAEEIIYLMEEELEFAKLPSRFCVGYEDSLAFIRENLAIFDLRSANVVMTDTGFVVPIDSFAVRLDQKAMEILAR